MPVFDLGKWIRALALDGGGVHGETGAEGAEAGMGSVVVKIVEEEQQAWMRAPPSSQFLGPSESSRGESHASHDAILLTTTRGRTISRILPGGAVEV